MFSPDEQWICVFADVTREAMRRARYPLNSCVAAGRIGVEVAVAFGYVVEPVPVAVYAVAGAEATVLPAPPDMRTGPRRRDGFEGHLILFFPGVSTMVDLTTDQFHDPHRGLLVPGPAIGVIDRSELAGDGAVADCETGTLIHYREMIGNVAWRALPAWQESPAMTACVVVRLMRERLASGAKRARSARRS